ncbi:DUF6629 family protein, partial [Streptomyces hirsutus]|uniref:DUF6629 family protein n=1 Tax=Streptomyces hirsutus TaxID=35620 RepID=UPI00332D576C
MCWSAEADLVAGAGIAAVGTAGAARALRAGRRRLHPLAALPRRRGGRPKLEGAVCGAGGGTGPRE